MDTDALRALNTAPMLMTGTSPYLCVDLRARKCMETEVKSKLTTFICIATALPAGSLQEEEESADVGLAKRTQWKRSTRTRSPHDFFHGTRRSTAILWVRFLLTFSSASPPKSSLIGFKDVAFSCLRRAPRQDRFCRRRCQVACAVQPVSGPFAAITE